jgi:hypothetical protein
LGDLNFGHSGLFQASIFEFRIFISVNCLPTHATSVCISAIMTKWLAVFGAIVFCVSLNSCTTLVTRRDLYSPEPGPDSYEVTKRWASTTTTTTTQTITNPAEPESTRQVPQFR